LPTWTLCATPLPGASHRCHHAAWLLPQPTGIDYTNAEWDEIAGLIKAKGILPILDLAYQGLGQGMEEDAYGIRTRSGRRARSADRL
jgi:aspartate/tyrosine/aromatic aminotransferase